MAPVKDLLKTYEEGKRDAGWAGLRLAALCIGVGAYNSKLSNLCALNARRDAEALFVATNKCPDCRAVIVRDPDNKNTILDNLNEFLAELAALPANKLPEAVLIFLAGHGRQQNSNVFLIPARTKCDNQMDLEDKGLSHIRVLEYLRNLLDATARNAHPPKEVKFVLILDMCRVPGEFDCTPRARAQRAAGRAPRGCRVCRERGCRVCRERATSTVEALRETSFSLTGCRVCRERASRELTTAFSLRGCRECRERASCARSFSLKRLQGRKEACAS
jgi:hypothetical protein